MKIVFLTDEFYPKFGANSLVVKSLAEEFVKNGHQAEVIPFSFDKTLPKTDVYNGIKIERIIPNDDKKSLLRNLFHGRIITATKIGVKFLKNKLLKSKKLSIKDNISARKILLDYIKAENVDVIISICCSVELSFPLLYLRKKGKLPCKWIFYMIDPFESHQYYRSIEKVDELRKIQHDIMKSCDAVVATSLIYEDTKQWETEEILNKITVVEFPKIQEYTKKPCEDDIKLDKSKINIVCTGSKNEAVRNSEYTFKLLDLLNIDNLNVHFVGHGWSDSDNVKDGKYFFYTARSHNAIKNLQLDADFLLNIGNVVTNQLPSKVLEYLSTGKPIINVYKSEKCPTLSLLNNYGSISLRESENIETNAKALSEFITKKHSYIDFIEIEKTYKEYTPNCVAKKFLSVIKDREKLDVFK